MKAVPHILRAAGLVALTIAVVAAQPLPRKTLAECLDIAMREHPDLQAAVTDVEAGHERTWQAASSALPQVNASYSADRRHTNATARTGAPVGSGTGQSVNRSLTFAFYSAGVSLSQILFDFGQSLDAIRAARATERSLEADATTARESVRLGVKEGYFSLLTATRLLAVADENVAQSQKHLDLAQGRFDVGLAARFDVTRAQVELANAELAQVTARNNVALARETLGSAIGLDGPLDFDVVDILGTHDVPIDVDEALDLAYAKRPELASHRLLEESLDHQIAALRKDHLPYVTGDASYVYSGQAYPLQETWNFGANVNLSLFNGGLTTARIGEAKANLSSAKHRERSLRQQVALEVRRAVLNAGQALESIRVSEKALGQARENVELAEGRYRTGVGNIIELTDAQAGLTTAEGNNVQALSNYKTAIAALEQATAHDFGLALGSP